MRLVHSAPRKRRRSPVLALVALLATASLAAAGPIAATPHFGSFTALVDGATVVSGAIGVNETGELYVGAVPFSTATADHLAVLTFTDISGMADPAVLFAVGATNLSDESTLFQFIFSIPIALEGTVVAHSGLVYGLSTMGTAGIGIEPAGVAILTAWDSDTSAGGLGDFNKGLDIGSGFYLPGDPGYADLGPFVGANIFAGDLAYDRMVVSVGFTLTPNTDVSLAGYVEQRAVPAPVPEPATLFLLAGGLAGILALKRNARG